MKDATRTSFVVLMALAVLALPAAVLAECMINGNVTAEMNDDNPEMGDWMYTMVVTWDTDTQYALSHFNFLIDGPGGTCGCSDIEAALTWASPAGSSDGDPDGCMVYYDAYLECEGDPSIPDVEGILLKFEPIYDEECEPGATGTGTFVFYSDFGPADIADEGLFLVDKFGQLNCTGMITGQFPSLLCDPVGAEAHTWSHVKGMYDR